MKRAPEKLLKALNEAEALHNANKISKAAQAGRQAYALAVEYLPVGHPERRRAARVLGLLLMNLNQKAEAERLLVESGDLQADGEIEAQVAARNTQATVRLQQGVTQETMTMVVENLQFAEEHLAADSKGVTMAMANLGMACEQNSDLKACEKIFSEVLRLRRAAGEREELLVAAILDLARIYLRTDQIRKCEPLYREALRLQEASGDEGLGLAVTLNQYGAVCQKLGRPQEAIQHLERSLALRRSILGADHAQVAISLRGLARVYLELEDGAKADEAMDMAWRINDRALGPHHPKTLQILVERGLNMMGMGPARAAEGLELVRKGDALAAVLPSNDPMRRDIRGFLATAEELYRRMCSAQGG